MEHRIRWIVDEDGDIGLSFFNIVTFIKYKEGVIVDWFKRYENAPRLLVK